MNLKVIDRKAMPPFGKRSELKLMHHKEISLDNGTKVFIFEDNSLDFIKFEYIINAGTSLQNKSLLAECAINLLNEGAALKSGEYISNRIEFFGAHYEPALSKDKASITLHSLSKTFARIIPIISELVFEPDFNNDNLQNYLNRKKQKFITDQAKIKVMAMRELNQRLFGTKTPYGRLAHLKDFDNVKRADVLSFHQENFKTHNNYIIVAGNVTDTIITALNQYFGYQELSPHANSNHEVYYETYETGFKFIPHKNTLQSVISLGRIIMAKANPDYAAFSVLNTILGGYFGSRLMSNLREKNGFTYGISSFVHNFKNADYWSVSSQVNAEHTSKAIDQINKEIQKLKNEIVSNEELALVKNYIYGAYLRGFDGALAQSDRFRYNYDINVDFSEYKNNLQMMMEVKPQQISDMANKYLSKDEMLYLVVGKYQKQSHN